jgi:DNA replication protein DnaC
VIFPAQFPDDREHEFAEKKVFNRLKSISDTHDVFYSKRFVNISGRKREYEVDFIIAKPNRYVIVLEVKGGVLKFENNQWLQNSRPLNKNPELQASSNCHALVKKYNQLSRHIPFIWMLCFPDCEMPANSKLPTNLTPYHILDRNGLFDVNKSIRLCIENLGVQAEAGNLREYVYSNFKSDLLRGIGMVRTLGTTIKYQEEKYVQLTSSQLKLINAIEENRRIIIHGAAGTGKTIVAKQIALNLYEQGESVLFLCFNRLLANKIRESLNIRKVDKKLFQVTTYHSIARDIITEFDDSWWDENSKSSEDFWTLDVPSKLDEILDTNEVCKYDVIIIDEGQDFKEFWFETLFKLCKSNARRYIFLDSMQNIFGHYSEVSDVNSYFRYRLVDNLRNTKSIVEYINSEVETEMKVADLSPVGEDVVHLDCINRVDLIKKLKDTIEDLVDIHNLSTTQILVMICGKKADSPISDVKKIGRFPLKSLDRKARFEKGTIHYTNIKTFKGLEQDVLIIINDSPVINSNYKQMFYTQASRAKHLLYVFSQKCGR